MASGNSVPTGTMSVAGFSANSNSTSSTTTTSTSSDSYSSNADDKTLHETYLFPFYNGVKAGLGTVMCAMNRVNSTYSCENSFLLQTLLKTELGFPGYVNPDVSSQKTALGSANGGLDQGSSSTWSATVMETLLSNGSLTQERFDDMAIRNAIAYFKAGMDTGNQPSYATSGDLRQVRGNHSALIRENGAKSLVLLKNNGVLPLKAPNTMALFGSHAGPAVAGPNYGFSVQGSGPIYEGHLATGSGSGQGSLGYVIDPHAAIVARAAKDGTFVRWILNNTYTGASSEGSLGNLLGSSSTALDGSFAGYAADTEVCICFINALAGEGADRTELRNTVQDDMIISVAADCNNTVVVIQTIGPRLVDSWIENENITAVLYSSLLGQESGNSIMDVLYGDVNPSGRLTYTIAKNESDYNVQVEETALQINYTEGM
jgi:beta-glucosidase